MLYYLKRIILGMEGVAASYEPDSDYSGITRKLVEQRMQINMFSDLTLGMNYLIAGSYCPCLGQTRYKL